MIVLVFRGVGRVSAFVERDSGASLPERYGPYSIVTQIKLTRGEAHPDVVVDTCMDDIVDFGIHVTDAATRITLDALSCRNPRATVAVARVPSDQSSSE